MKTALLYVEINTKSEKHSNNISGFLLHTQCCHNTQTPTHKTHVDTSHQQHLIVFYKICI